MRFALLFLLGISLSLQLSDLPNAHILWLFLPLIYCIFRLPNTRLFLALPFGFLWVVAHGLWTLSSELPERLIKQDIIVTGKISSLPDSSSIRTRFVLDVDTIKFQNTFVEGPRRIRLNWYGRTPKIHAGQQWQFQVRLKPAHGMYNPGGMDYEKWLFERGIRATGYVRKSEFNQLLQAANPFSANALRDKLRSQIQHLLPDNAYRGLILALAIGDRSEISDDQWQVLTATGTNHLVAISGLHIGLVAGGVYFIVLFLFKRSRRVILILPAHKAAAIFALSAAFMYAMLAGFAIPTQRALIMITVVMLGTLLNKRFNFVQIISYSLIAVLLLDPFSSLSTGFWLSFIAVAAILYAMQGRLSPQGLWWQWGRVQWIVTVALIPVLIFAFQSFSLVSPLANILAVPLVSFVTVPLLFLGIIFLLVEPLALLLFNLTSFSLQGLWWTLEYFANLPFAQWQQFVPQSWTLLPALMGILLAMAPRGFPARYLSIIFLLPLFFVKPEKMSANEVGFYLLDVGQGLSAVVQTQNHVLVFDTGPKFRSGFNTGESVVIPFLKNLAVDKLDVLVISHGDNDHIGGMQGILDNIAVDKILSGAMQKTPQVNAEPCLMGLSWQWDGVDFEILHPTTTDFINKGNNGSCVLRVSVSNHRFLLTGDIEAKAEQYLVKTLPEKLKSTVVVAPHHGSNTSSTFSFVQLLDPDWVLYPAGYLNRFKFPRQKVFKRYEDLGAKYLVTGNQGAIRFFVDKNSNLTMSSYRNEYRRFWQNSAIIQDVQ